MTRRTVLATLSLIVGLLPAAAGAAEGPAPLTRVIVQVTPGSAPQAVAVDVVQRFGGSTGFIYTHAVTGFSAELPQAAIEALANNPSVVSISPDYPISIATQEVPTGYDRIEADLAPAAPTSATGCPTGETCTDVDIAILDTGVADHPDLNVVARTDCVFTGLLYPTCNDGQGSDGHGHGTHVAGTSAAFDNGFGVVGVAPGARLHSVKVLDDSGSGYLSGMIAGIDWVTARADVIEVANMSLGGTFSEPTFDTAISNAVAAGVVFAAAAGNSATDAATFSPANHPDVITVSAVADADGGAGGLSGFRCRKGELDDTFATFSNYGEVVDIAAPGVCITSTWNDGGYRTISGTSMATPHVAGAAARYVAINGRDVDGNGTVDGADAAAIKAVLVSGGHAQTSPCGFGGDPDGFAEPLLFVNGTAFGGSGECQQEPVDDTPPSEVTVTAVADGYPVDVSWTASEDLDSGLLEYRIYRDAGSGPVLVGTAPYDATSYRDTDTAPATTYSYQVEAVNLQFGVSPLSAPAVATTSSDDPTHAGWWAFEDGTGTIATDSTAWRRHAALANGVAWTTGRVDAGVGFDGFDDRIDLDPAVLNGSSDVTVSFWINTTDTGQQALVSGANAGNDNEYLLFLPTSDTLRFYPGHSSTTGVEWDLGGSIADGVWHHLAVVRDQTRNRVDAYLDGKWIGAWGLTVTLTDLEIEALVVGQDQDTVGGGYQTSEAMTGFLDELHVHTRVLTAAEVAALALVDDTPPTAPTEVIAVGYDSHVDLGWAEAVDDDSGVSGYQIWRDDGLGGALGLQQTVDDTQLTWRDTAVRAGLTYRYEVVALNGNEIAGPASDTVSAEIGSGDGSLAGWWSFDDGTGTVAEDWSGYGRHGTLIGGGWESGGLNGAVTLGGGTDRVELDAAVLDGVDDVSLSVWFRTTSTARVQALISGVNSGGDEFLVAFIDQTELRIYTGETNETHAKYSVPATNDGDWHHLVVLRDGGNDQVTVYLDGVSYGTQTHVLNPLSIATGGLMLGQEQDTVGGGFDTTQVFAGSVDELRIYHRLLDADEVAGLGGMYAPVIDTEPPAAPVGLAAEVVDGTVALSWTANSEPDLASYTVYRAVGAGTLEELATGVVQADFVDTTVVAAETYTYAVTAVDQAGNESAMSATVTVTIEASTETVTVVAGSESTSTGSVAAGDLTATHADDGTVEVLQETESGGRPDRRVTSLVHEWTFDLGTAVSTEIWVDASWDSSGADDFVFTYASSAGSGVLTVNNGGGAAATAVSGLTGIVTIRVEDTDRTPGERTLDSVAVDYLAIVATAGDAGDPGDPGGGDVGLATGESAGFGTVLGGYEATWAADDVVQTLSEEQWAGGSRTRLEHTWTVAVPGGGAAAFGLEATVDGSESFVFECSVDGSSWTSVQTVAGTVTGTVAFPCSSAVGSVLIRVTDTNRNKGDSTVSWIEIDWLYVTS